jgi:hypothetical protein
MTTKDKGALARALPLRHKCSGAPSFAIFAKRGIKSAQPATMPLPFLLVIPEADLLLPLLLLLPLPLLFKLSSFAEGGGPAVAFDFAFAVAVATAYLATGSPSHSAPIPHRGCVNPHSFHSLSQAHISDVAFAGRGNPN